MEIDYTNRIRQMSNTMQYVGIGAASALSAFIEASLAPISIWLLVILWVVIADLFMGLYKAYRAGEKIRPSRGLRDTMGKIAAYFAFVVTIVFLQQVYGCDNFGQYACGLIIFGEGLSIVGNFFKAHGYTLNTDKILDKATGKIGLGKGVVTKDKDNGKH